MPRIVALFCQPTLFFVSPFPWNDFYLFSYVGAEWFVLQTTRLDIE